MTQGRLRLFVVGGTLAVGVCLTIVGARAENPKLAPDVAVQDASGAVVYHGCAQLGDVVPRVTRLELAGELDVALVLAFVVDHGLAPRGEPLLRRDVFEMADVFRAQGLKLHLLTSGLFLERDAEQVATRFEEVTLSLDGHSRDLYRQIRGVDGLDVIERGVGLVEARLHESRVGRDGAGEAGASRERADPVDGQGPGNRLLAGGRAEAAPSPISRVAHQGRAHRIQDDVAADFVEIGRAVDELRAEPSLQDVAAPLVTSVEPLGER